MKWSHTDLERLLRRTQEYVQGHKVKVGTVCTLAVASVVMYGAGVSSLNRERTLESSEVLRVEAEQHSDDQTRPLRQMTSESNLRTTDNDNPPSVTGSVQVNDTHIPIPPRGEVHKQVRTEDGTTKVDISVDSRSTTQHNSSQQTTLNIDVESRSETDYGQESGP